MLVKQNTATHLPLYIVLDDHITPATGLTSGSFSVNQISKNAAAFGALTVTITERAYGWYDLTLASGDCDTLGALVLHFEGTGLDNVDVLLQVVALDFTLATITLTDGSITAAKFAANAITAAVIADAAIDAATFAAGAINAAAIAADAITAAKVADGTIDAATFAAGAINAAAIADGAIDAATFAANAITSTVIAADAIGASQIAADAIGSSELAASAVTEIQTGLGTTANQATIASAIAAVQADTDNIQTRLPAALIMGRMDATAIVTEVGSGAIAEASFQDGAITAAKVEADTYQAIAGYVWEEDATTHTNPDTFGKYVADLWNGFGGTTLGDILDGIDNVPSSVWAFAHESGRTAKGVLVRLDALMTGKATGLLGVLATFFRSDGTTKAIEATQDPTLGTRSQASTIGGD